LPTSADVGARFITPSDVEELLSRLASAPGRFASALARLDDADSITSIQPGEWSPAEILAHVRASHAILEPRLFHMLVRDNSPLPAFDERRWAEIARFAALPITASLETMSLQRKELVYALRGLSAADWERTGTHEISGPLTVYRLARNIADHDDEHCAQIEQIGAVRGGATNV
jgi:DinB superfamily